MFMKRGIIFILLSSILITSVLAIPDWYNFQDDVNSYAEFITGRQIRDDELKPSFIDRQPPNDDTTNIPPSDPGIKPIFDDRAIDTRPTTVIKKPQEKNIP